MKKGERIVMGVNLCIVISTAFTGTVVALTKPEARTAVATCAGAVIIAFLNVVLVFAGYCTEWRFE